MVEKVPKFDEYEFKKLANKKSGLVVARILDGNTGVHLEITFTGKFTTAGINSSTFGDKETHSFGFASTESAATFSKKLNLMTEPFKHEGLAGYTVAPITKGGDIIYFKVKKGDDGAWAVKTNDPNKLTSIEAGSPVKVTAQIHGYFNVDDKVCGVYYTVLKVDVPKF